MMLFNVRLPSSDVMTGQEELVTFHCLTSFIRHTWFRHLMKQSRRASYPASHWLWPWFLEPGGFVSGFYRKLLISWDFNKQQSVKFSQHGAWNEKRQYGKMPCRSETKMTEDGSLQYFKETPVTPVVSRKAIQDTERTWWTWGGLSVHEHRLTKTVLFKKKKKVTEMYPFQHNVGVSNFPIHHSQGWDRAMFIHLFIFITTMPAFWEESGEREGNLFTRGEKVK